MIPIEFIRQFRFFGYAIFDFVVAFLGIYLLAPFLSKIFLKIGIDIPKQNWLFLTLPIAIISHVIVGNITPMTRDFIDMHNHFILKSLILFLLFLGMRGVRIVKKNS